MVNFVKYDCTILHIYPKHKMGMRCVPYGSLCAKGRNVLGPKVWIV